MRSHSEDDVLLMVTIGGVISCDWNGLICYFALCRRNNVRHKSHYTCRICFPSRVLRNYGTSCRQVFIHVINATLTRFSAESTENNKELVACHAHESFVIWIATINNVTLLVVNGHGRSTIFRMPIYPMLNRWNANPMTPNPGL